MADNMAKEAGEKTEAEKAETMDTAISINDDPGALIDATQKKPWSDAKVAKAMEWSARIRKSKKKAKQVIIPALAAKLWDGARAKAALKGSAEARVAAVLDGLWTQFVQSGYAMKMEDMRKFVRVESLRAELYPPGTTVDDMYHDPDPDHVKSLGPKADDIHRRIMEVMSG